MKGKVYVNGVFTKNIQISKDLLPHYGRIHLKFLLHPIVDMRNGVWNFFTGEGDDSTWELNPLSIPDNIADLI